MYAAGHYSSLFLSNFLVPIKKNAEKLNDGKHITSTTISYLTGGRKFSTTIDFVSNIAV